MVIREQLFIRDDENRMQATILMPEDIIYWSKGLMYARFSRDGRKILLGKNDTVILIENAVAFCDLVELLAAIRGLYYEKTSDSEEEIIRFRFIDK